MCSLEFHTCAICAPTRYFTHASIIPTIHQSTNPSINPPIHTSIHKSIRKSTNPSIKPPFHPSIHQMRAVDGREGGGHANYDANDNYDHDYSDLGDDFVSGGARVRRYHELALLLQVTKSDSCRILLVTFGHFWSPLVTLGHFWSPLVTFGHFE
jgi:hypothetical protein